jgi:thioredoxin-related protein
MTEEIATGLLFTSETCPHCSIAKKYFDEIKEMRSDIELHFVSVNEAKGKNMALGFGIQSVPSFLFYGPGHIEPMGLVGAQTKENILKYIDIAIGKNKLKKKPSFSVKNFLKKRP